MIKSQRKILRYLSLKRLKNFWAAISKTQNSSHNSSRAHPWQSSNFQSSLSSLKSPLNSATRLLKSKTRLRTCQTSEDYWPESPSCLLSKTMLSPVTNLDTVSFCFLLSYSLLSLLAKQNLLSIRWNQMRKEKKWSKQMTQHQRESPKRNPSASSIDSSLSPISFWWKNLRLSVHWELWLTWTTSWFRKMIHSSSVVRTHRLREACFSLKSRVAQVTTSIASVRWDNSRRELLSTWFTIQKRHSWSQSMKLRPMRSSQRKSHRMRTNPRIQ